MRGDARGTRPRLADKALPPSLLAEGGKKLRLKASEKGKKHPPKKRLCAGVEMAGQRCGAPALRVPIENAEQVTGKKKNAARFGIKERLE